MINAEPFFNASTTEKWLNNNVTGVANRRLLACLCSLLLLVLLLGEDVPTINIGRSCLHLEIAQTNGRLQSISNSQLTGKKQLGCRIQM
jgi:hypothetical protein